MSDLQVNRRRTPLADGTALDATERAQLERVLRAEDVTLDAARKSEEWADLELLDVQRDGALAYRLVLYPFGNGVLFEVTGTRAVLDVVQHHAELRPGTPPELAEALVAALARDGAALGVKQQFDFVRPAPRKPLEDEALLTAIERELAARKRLSDEAGDALFAAVAKRFGTRERPVTADELTPASKRLLVAMARGGRYHHRDLARFGLPTDEAGLLVLAGEREAQGLRAVVSVAGERRSIVEHARLVVKGKLDGDALIEAIVGLGQPAAVAVLDRLLRFDRDERITSFPWGASEAAAAAWLVRLVLRLGDAGRATAANLAVEDLAAGAVARAYVWALTARRIDATPRAIAQRVRQLFTEASPQERTDAALLLEPLLARLPDGAALVEGVSTHTWYPPGQPVKGVHRGAGFAQIEPAALAAARGTRAPALLEDVARLHGRCMLLGWKPQAAEALAILVDAGDAGRAAVQRALAGHPELATPLTLAAKKLGVSTTKRPAAKAPAPAKPRVAPTEKTAKQTTSERAKKTTVKKAPGKRTSRSSVRGRRG